MEFEFDPDKNEGNIRKHGLSLADFRGFDAGTDLTIEDDRRDFGETKFRTFGRIIGAPHMIAFTVRGEKIRLISFRRTHEKELRRYAAVD